MPLDRVQTRGRGITCNSLQGINLIPGFMTGKIGQDKAT